MIFNDENIDGNLHASMNLNNSMHSSVRKSVRFDIPLVKGVLQPTDYNEVPIPPLKESKPVKLEIERLHKDDPVFQIVSEVFSGEESTQKESQALKSVINKIFYKAGLTFSDFLSLDPSSGTSPMAESLPDSIMEINGRQINLNEMKNSLLQLKMHEINKEAKKRSFIDNTILYELSVIRASLAHDEVATKRLQLKDRQIRIDVDWQNKFCELIFCVHMPWLLFAIKILFLHEITPAKIDRSKATNLDEEKLHMLRYREPIKRFVKSFFFEGNTGSKTSKFSSSSQINESFILNFFSLVYFLDKIKTHSILNYNKLFVSSSPIKSTAQLLQTFLTEFIKNQEGNYLKRLSASYSFSLTFVQTPMNEYDFSVEDLSEDMRDGIKLIKLVEIWNNVSEEPQFEEEGERSYVSSQTSVIRLSTKKNLKAHNLNILYDLLKSLRVFSPSELSIFFSSSRTLAGASSSRSISDGSISKTLSLLYRLLYEYDYNLMVNHKEVLREVSAIDRETRYYHNFYHDLAPQSVLARGRLSQQVSGVSSAEEVLVLWSQWVSLATYRFTHWSSLANRSKFFAEGTTHEGFLVAGFNSLSPEDAQTSNPFNLLENYRAFPDTFVSLMLDGRIFCLLIHYYFPSIFKRDFILELISDSLRLTNHQKMTADQQAKVQQRNLKQLQAAMKELRFPSWELVTYFLASDGPQRDAGRDEKFIMLLLASIFKRARRLGPLIRSVVKLQRVFHKSFYQIKRSNELKKINSLLDTVRSSLNLPGDRKSTSFSIPFDQRPLPTIPHSSSDSARPTSKSKIPRVSKSATFSPYSPSLGYSSTPHVEVKQPASPPKADLSDLSFLSPGAGDFNVINGKYFDYDTSLMDETQVSAESLGSTPPHTEEVSSPSIENLEKRLEMLKSGVSDPLEVPLFSLPPPPQVESFMSAPSAPKPRGVMRKQQLKTKLRLASKKNNQKPPLMVPAHEELAFLPSDKIQRTPVKQATPPERAHTNDDSFNCSALNLSDSNMDNFRFDAIEFELNNLTMNDSLPSPYHERDHGEPHFEQCISDLTMMEDSYHDTFTTPQEAEDSACKTSEQMPYDKSISPISKYLSNSQNYELYTPDSPHFDPFINSFYLEINDDQMKSLCFLQSIVRTFITRRRFLRAREAAKLIGKTIRGFLVRKKYQNELLMMLIKLNNDHFQQKIMSIKDSLSDFTGRFPLLRKDHNGLVKVLANLLSLIKTLKSLPSHLASDPYNIHMDMFNLLRGFLTSDISSLKNKNIMEVFLSIFYCLSCTSSVASNMGAAVFNMPGSSNGHCAFLFIQLMKYYREEYDVLLASSEIFKNIIKASPVLRQNLIKSDPHLSIISNLKQILISKEITVIAKYQSLIEYGSNQSINEEFMQEFESTKNEKILIECSKKNLECILQVIQP